MPIQHFKAAVSQVLDLTHDVREINLRLLDPPAVVFKAGQFISFEVINPQIQRPVVRPYSIASPPSRPDIDLVLNLVAGGPGSTYLFGLKEGDETRFTGPAGSFYLREDDSRAHLFVATGTGIAPLRSMLYALLERRNSRPVRLYWGLRSERDLYYQDELGRLASTYPNFSFITTLSRPETGWAGERGRVTRLVEERITSVQDLAVYLCGNGGMIKEVTQIVRSKGLCPVYREKYYDDEGESEP